MPAARVGRQPKAAMEGLARLETEVQGANRTSAETLTLLETLLSKSPVGFGFVDRDFRMLRLNETLATLNGSTVAAQLGHTVAELVPELWPQLEPLYRHVLESGESVVDVRVDVSSPADPSATFQRTASYYPVSVAGEVIGIGIVLVDITERTKAEQDVHFQADLLAAAGQAMIASDLAGVVLYWNRAAQELYGWSADDAIGRTVGDLIDREDTTAERSAILEGLHRGESWSGDVWVKHRDGTRFAVHLAESPVVDEDGQLVAIIAVSADVTERLAGEEARRQLVAIVEGSGDAIFAVANDGLVTAWNAAAERLFGYTAEEIVGHSIAALTPPEKVAEQQEVRARVTAGGPAERIETTRCRKDGSIVEVVLTVSRVADKAGTPLGLSVISHDITERRAARHNLELSLRRLAEAQRVAHLGSAESNLVTGEITRSDEYCRILGVDQGADLSSDQVIAMVHPDDRPAVAEAWEKAVERGVPFDIACRIVRPDSAERRVRFSIAPEVGVAGNVIKVLATLLDETERVEAERVQRSAEARFEVGFEQAGIGAVIVDLGGVPIRVNAAVESLLGRTADELLGHPWVEYTHPDEIPLGRVVNARVAEGHDTYADERRYVRPDGAVVWAACHVTLVRDESGQPLYFFGQMQDITERKQMEEALSQQALHDTLTGLPNRALITDRLLHNLGGVRRRNTHLGVVFLNIDHFQHINESLGYEAGDEVLRHVAELITSTIRPGDSVARFGGDEFVVVCDNVTILEVERIAERILEAVSQPFLVGDQHLKATASLGIALADRNATPESLLRDSAAAMHRAKQRGRSRIELFDAALRSKAERRFATGTALRQALERGEFLVYYQPVVDLTTGALVDAEALVRWQHPHRGLLLPAEFIPVAEEIGVIEPIGAFVLEQACQQLVQWRRTDPTMTVSVNLSVRQMLIPDIARVVDDVLKSTGAPPGSLCLELTESVFMDDVEYFGATLAALKTLGVRLSIDDFGTGYSSLSYLKKFPVDAVKVDRAFVDGLGADTNDTALVAAIIAMAAALGLEVTAEGVETHDQLINLKRLRCHRAQGFYLARPMPPAAVSQLIAEAHRWQVE